MRVVVYKYSNKKGKMDMYDVCEGSHRDVDKWLYSNYPTATLKKIQMANISIQSMIYSMEFNMLQIRKAFLKLIVLPSHSVNISTSGDIDTSLIPNDNGVLVIDSKTNLAGNKNIIMMLLQRQCMPISNLNIQGILNM